jgi:hypothetical protein
VRVFLLSSRLGRYQIVAIDWIGSNGCHPSVPPDTLGWYRIRVDRWKGKVVFSHQQTVERQELPPIWPRPRRPLLVSARRPRHPAQASMPKPWGPPPVSSLHRDGEAAKSKLKQADDPPPPLPLLPTPMMTTGIATPATGATRDEAGKMKLPRRP